MIMAQLEDKVDIDTGVDTNAVRDFLSTAIGKAEALMRVMS